MRAVRLLPEVVGDVARAANRYDREGYPGLGARFEAAFYARLPGIGRHGASHRYVYKAFKRCWLRPFPYAVYYREHGDWWVVALVVHGARSPRTVKRLLAKRPAR